eukprot:CAMPEP_0114252514 /NCGR_PEP_ID=MMETSP0058-20121206/15879_1 /TAXON_ID=36894 /ORGANISM="Pyramimonas parkeae, CCMP726" /LENGTH=206 /DNA_ID=CAMNT_0001366457 /DNA_START=231 /DNA_END=852 /DNA_ORIENTATION=+
MGAKFNRPPEWWEEGQKRVITFLENYGFAVLAVMAIICWAWPRLSAFFSAIQQRALHAAGPLDPDLEERRRAARLHQQQAAERAQAEHELQERERRAKAAEARMQDLDKKAESLYLKPKGHGRKLGSGEEDSSTKDNDNGMGGPRPHAGPSSNAASSAPPPPDPLLGKPLAEATTHLQALGEAAASVPLGPAQAEADDARFPLNFP